jgi:hypothetical protein
MGGEILSTNSFKIKTGVENNKLPELHQKISNEIAKAFSNPMTDQQLQQYDQLATEANEKTMLTGKIDEEAESKLQEMIDSHSAIAENSEEFYELLSQMNNNPNRPPGFDFVEKYYQHELSHNQKADELGYLNKGFRVLIIREEDRHLSFLPTQAAEPRPNWTLEEYYQKQLEVIKAPKGDMSDGDKQDYEYFSQKLELLKK